jgi:hypothetical protein
MQRQIDVAFLVTQRVGGIEESDLFERLIRRTDFFFQLLASVVGQIAILMLFPSRGSLLWLHAAYRSYS